MLDWDVIHVRALEVPSSIPGVFNPEPARNRAEYRDYILTSREDFGPFDAPPFFPPSFFPPSFFPLA